jgi:hypothetical protein
MREMDLMGQDDAVLLSKMSDKMDRILLGQDEIIEMLTKRSRVTPEKKKMTKKVESEPLDVVTLLSLPDNLRKTAYAISKLGECTAEQVAKETERTRAIESVYLNQLHRMGHLSRKRKSHAIIYSVT